jgi:hypothetical protein
LIVLRRGKAQLNVGAPGDEIHGQQITPINVCAVRGERVDFFR